MPDVGVLNLTIKDNSEQAVKGLEALDDVLLRIRHVVSGALGLGKVANEIKRIGRAVEENLTDSTLTKIGQLATELSKLQGLGSLNIKINGGTSIESIRDAVRETMQDMGAINTGFDDVKSRAYDAKAGIDGINSSIRDTQQLMQNTAWTGGLNQFREMFEEYSRIRSALSLPAGEQTGISTEVEKGWTAWKDGAIEVEGTVSEAMDTVIGYLEQPGGYLTGIVSDLNNVNSGLHSTKDAVDGVAGAAGSAKAAVASTLKEFEHLEKNGMFRSYMYGPRNDIESIDTTGFMKGYETEEERMAMNPQWYQSIVQAEEGYERVAEAADKAAPSVQNFTNTMEQAANQNANADMSFIDNLISKSSDVDLLNMKIESLTDRLYEGATSGKMTGEQIADMISRIRKLRDEVESLQTTTYGMSGAWDSFRAGMKRMFPTITSLLGRFKQLVKYRMLRSVLRHITSGFSEGVQNVYNYSKAVGTSLAPAMDQAATVLQQMKNSVGAAVAPLIQSLVPVLQTVVNWFITAMNYANQFFALMRGQTSWTRALPEQAEAFEKSSKSAKNASKAMKDLLADWDELNIIQSQGSDGSGSGTGKTVAEYSQMFEEVNEFNDQIKSATSFIEDHLGGITEVLKKAGIMLLGWKFSKAFTGFLGTLGKLVAGGALIYIGFELAGGAGFDAGSKGYWETQDIIRGVLGGLASAIGGSLITAALGMGGAVGFAIGLTGAIIITLNGWIKGQKDLEDKNKWGNLTMTQEQIEEFVRKQFTFPVDAEIQVMKAHIADTNDAEEKVNEAVRQFNTSLDDAEKIVADIETTTAKEKVAAVKKAAEDAKATVEALNSLIQTNEKGLEFTLTNFTFRNEGGEDITDELLESIKGADATLSEYFTGLGEKLAKLIYEGEKSGWKNGELEQAMELMRSQKRILDNAEQIETQLRFETQFSAALDKVTSRKTAQATMEEQKRMFAEYEDTVTQMVQEQVYGLESLAAKAYAAALEAGEDTEQGKALKAKGDEYIADAKKILDGLQDAIDEKLGPTRKLMADKWAEVLKVVYGGDFEDAAETAAKGHVFDIDWTDYFLDPFGTGYLISAESVNEHGISETASKLYEQILTQMLNPDKDPTGIINYYLKELGGNIYDVMTDDARQTLLKSLYDATEDLDMAEQIFMQMFNVPREDIEKYAKELSGSANEVVKEAAQKTERPWWDFWSFIPPDSNEPAITDENKQKIFDDLYENPADYFKEYEESQGAIILPVDIWITNADEAMELLKEDITAAVEDGVLDYEELQNLVEKYHSDKMLEEALKELQITLDDEGYLTGDNARKAMRHMASMGMSDVGWGNGTYYPSGDNQSLTDQDISGNVENGVKAGNVEQNALLEQMITLLGRIAGKELVVKFTPSSSMGAVVGASTALFGRVTGNN